MGSRLGRNRNAAADPFYNAVPPAPPNAPNSGLDVYDPYEEYGYGNQLGSSIGNMYGRPTLPRTTKYRGLYAQGLNQFPGICPWNYGNYYLGNTTMQMMPFMLNKVAKYGQMQAMAALGNAGLLGGAPMMPCCIPPPCNMPMASPMMAAATPLPIAFNPLVQGMYPIASMSPVNWMTPSSFMSALASGPMPYRPPAFDFPRNVGMVMTIPYGTPNPLFSSPQYGGFSSSYSFGGGGSSCCCFSYSIPPPVLAPPSISYYPRPVCVPQPYAAPYPAPVAIPNVKQVPVPRSVCVIAPPVIADCNRQIPASSSNPLWPSQGVFTNGGVGQPLVMASNRNSSNTTLVTNETAIGSLPVYNALDKSNSLIGQKISSSLSNSALNNSELSGVTPSKAKNRSRLSRTRDDLYDRFRRYMPSIPRLSRSNYDLSTFRPRVDPILPPISQGVLIADSGWLPKHSEFETVSSVITRRKKRLPLYTSKNGKSMLYSDGAHVSFLPRRRRKHSSSSVSEYDCAICQQEREKRRLRKYYSSSTISSLLSEPKEKRNRLLSSKASSVSSLRHSPKRGHKSRRHPERPKRRSKSPTNNKSNSPKLIRRSPIHDPRTNSTIHEVDEEKEE